MAEYMAQRVIDEVFTYTFIIVKMKAYKDRIDKYLTDNGRADLIVDNVGLIQYKIRLLKTSVQKQAFLF